MSKSESGTLAQSTVTGFDSWVSDPIQTDTGTEVTIQVTIASTGTTDPVIKIKGVLSGTTYGYIRDSNQDVIEITLEETVNIRTLWLPKVGSIVLCGSTNGVGSGDLTDITVERK